MIAIKNILLPTDFSEPATVAAKYALALAQEFGSTVHLLHVIELVPAEVMLTHFSKQDVQDKLSQHAADELQKLNEALGDYNVPLETLIRSGNPAVEISRAAEDADIDLIVMGTHGRGGVAHALVGSVAERTVRRAPCAVMTVRDS